MELVNIKNYFVITFETVSFLKLGLIFVASEPKSNQKIIWLHQFSKQKICILLALHHTVLQKWDHATAADGNNTFVCWASGVISISGFRMSKREKISIPFFLLLPSLAIIQASHPPGSLTNAFQIVPTYFLLFWVPSRKR